MTTAPAPETYDGSGPSPAEIAAAHARIAPRIHRTPVLTSASLDALAGARLYFKCENLQKTGSFKIRGATNAIFSLSDAEAAHGIVTHSSGNHAAAVACAARWRGVPAWIVMPRNASAVKCRAVEAYGGQITFCEPKVSARTEAAARIQLPELTPNMIWLYRRPILDYWAEHEDTLGEIVTHVLVHEIGHHFGLSDEDMEAIEASVE